MAFRHAAMVFLIILFCFCSAASSQLWAQWLVAVIFVGVMLLVDLIFLDDSSFIFDPDPDNWRRRVERSE